MLNGIGKLSSVSTTNVCRRDGDVLLNTLEDDLHTRVPLLLKTKRTSILPTIFLNKCTSIFNNSMYKCIRAQGRALTNIFSWGAQA